MWAHRVRSRGYNRSLFSDIILIIWTLRKIDMEWNIHRLSSTCPDELYGSIEHAHCAGYRCYFLDGELVLFGWPESLAVVGAEGVKAGVVEGNSSRSQSVFLSLVEPSWHSLPSLKISSIQSPNHRDPITISIAFPGSWISHTKNAFLLVEAVDPGRWTLDPQQWECRLFLNQSQQRRKWSVPGYIVEDPKSFSDELESNEEQSDLPCQFQWRGGGYR